MLSPRERVLCALNHEEPDRVPIFFGTSGATTMLAPGYERLKTYLGIKASERFLSTTLQYAQIDEEILVRFGSDGRHILPGPVPFAPRQQEIENCLVDEWGIKWQRQAGSYYYGVVNPPLRNATADDLDKYPWPALSHPDRFTGLAEEAREVQAAGYATVLMSGVAPFEQARTLRGQEAWLAGLILNPEFNCALLRKLTDVMLASVLAALEQAGEYVDVLVMADDLGAQNAPLISPKMYRSMIKPYHAQLIAAIKSKTKAKVFFHSDGNIYPLIGDLIDIGVDILNPVQVSSKEMGDTARLKREFGANLSFCGAIDTQWVLPHGTPADVRQEVRRRIKDLGPGGGYICASVHCMQPDVPPENVLALFEEAAVAGQYPLQHLS
ncbi:MAG: uroporphyrinogen decarboxylase family protein [Chloroflexota bacterium]